MGLSSVQLREKLAALHMKKTSHAKKSPHACGSARQEPIQISKEYFQGKWQHVTFYKDKLGSISIEPIEQGGR